MSKIFLCFFLLYDVTITEPAVDEKLPNKFDDVTTVDDVITCSTECCWSVAVSTWEAGS